VHYHFSIIDYFQKWNLQKITEKHTKQLIKFNPNLDTSAQNPSVYADRFQEHVVDGLFRTADEEPIKLGRKTSA
jgi:hypothetical protein